MKNLIRRSTFSLIALLMSMSLMLSANAASMLVSSNVLHPQKGVMERCGSGLFAANGDVLYKISQDGKRISEISKGLFSYYEVFTYGDKVFYTTRKGICYYSNTDCRTHLFKKMPDTILDICSSGVIADHNQKSIKLYSFNGGVKKLAGKSLNYVGRSNKRLFFMKKIRVNRKNSDTAYRLMTCRFNGKGFKKKGRFSLANDAEVSESHECTDFCLLKKTAYMICGQYSGSGHFFVNGRLFKMKRNGTHIEKVQDVSQNAFLPYGKRVLLNNNDLTGTAHTASAYICGPRGVRKKRIRYGKNLAAKYKVGRAGYLIEKGKRVYIQSKPQPGRRGNHTKPQQVLSLKKHIRKGDPKDAYTAMNFFGSSGDVAIVKFMVLSDSRKFRQGWRPGMVRNYIYSINVRTGRKRLLKTEKGGGIPYY